MSIFTPARRVLYAPSEEAIQVPFVIDRHAGVLPSFATDFAHNAGESEYPECWRGLVGFWPIFLGQTGGKVIDLSGNENTGTFESSPLWSSGKYGAAILFDSSGDMVNCGNKSVLDVTEITLIVGFNANNWTTGGASFKGIITKRDVFASYNWELYYHNTGGITELRFAWRDSESTGQTAFINDGVKPSTGVPYILAVTCKAGEQRLYLDGVLEASDNIANTIGLTGDSVRIGVMGNDYKIAEGSFDGIIDFAMIHNRVLSPSEIAFLSSNPTALVQLRRRVVMVSLGEVVGGIDYEDLLLGVSVSASVSETDTQQMTDTLKDVSIAASILEADTQQMLDTEKDVSIAASISEADTQQMLDTEKVVTFAASVSVTDILSGVVNYEDLLLGVSISASVTEADTQQMVDTEKAVTFAAGVSEVDIQQMLDTDKAVSFAASVSETDTQQMVDTDLGVTVVASLNIADTQQMKDLLKDVTFVASITETDTQQMKDLLKAITFAASCGIETEVYYDASAVVVAMYAFIILRQHTS